MFENKLCIKRKDIMERLNTVVGEVPTNHTYSKFMVVSVNTPYLVLKAFIILHVQHCGFFFVF